MALGAEQKTDQFISGSTIKSLVVLAGPIVFANILQTAYQLVDTFWVGRLGAAAVGAISASFPLIFLLIALGGGLAITGSVFVAQYAGAKQYAMVNHASGQTLLMVISVSLLLSVIGYLSAPAALRLVGVGPEIHDDALGYLRISFYGLVFGFTYMVFQSILRGIGEVRLPLYVISATVLLNAILDPLFIFGWGPIPGRGVVGAAYATVTTQAVAAVAGLAILLSGRFGMHLRLADFRPDFAFIRRAAWLGIPASLEQATRSIGMVFLTYLATGFGTLGLATLGMGMRMISLVIIPAIGLSMATATIVGQNIGAGQLERVHEVTRMSAWLGFWILNGIGLLFFIFARPMIRVFVPADEELVATAALYVCIAAPSFGLMAAEQAFLGALRGAGAMAAAMTISLTTQWLFQYPVAIGLAYFTPLGMAGLWWGFPLATVVTFLATYWWYRRGSWKKIQLTDRKRLGDSVTDEIITEEAIP